MLDEAVRANDRELEANEILPNFSPRHAQSTQEAPLLFKDIDCERKSIEEFSLKFCNGVIFFFYSNKLYKIILSTASFQVFLSFQKKKKNNLMSVDANLK